MSKIAFVTGSDSNYFPLIAEWIHCIRNHPDNKLKDFDICIMDTGMSDEQHTYIKTLADKVVKPDWPCDIPVRRIRGREYLKSCVCRPFINKIFAGYDVYIWLDGDSWVQDWQAIDLLIKGAGKSDLAICPQADRAYGKAMRLKWLGPFPWKARSFYYSNAKKAFNGKIARELFPYSALNAGVFSLRGNAPHWDRWQKLLLKALQKGKVFTAEQLTLGILIYIDGYSAEFLPAYCNWLCDTAPSWDEDAQIFVEPYLPNHPIGVMHLSGCDKMRVDRSEARECTTLKGKTIMMNYRYRGFNGENINHQNDDLIANT